MLGGLYVDGYHEGERLTERNVGSDAPESKRLGLTTGHGDGRKSDVRGVGFCHAFRVLDGRPDVQMTLTRLLTLTVRPHPMKNGKKRAQFPREAQSA